MEEILEMVNTELKAYGAHDQKKKLIAGLVLTGGGSNLKNLRQLANYIIGFDSRIGFANEHIVNDKNQYLKSPEYATSIGLLMESLKINERKPKEEEIPQPVQETEEELSLKITTKPEVEEKTIESEEKDISENSKKTFGQKFWAQVRSFFEEAE